MIRKYSLFIVAAVASIGFAAKAHAQQGAAQVSNYKGTNVGTSVNFGPGVVCADGSEGSAFGFGFLFASESISHQPGGPPSGSSGVSIDLFGYFDTCTNRYIDFGIGGLSGGYQGPNPALKSAAISGTTTVQNLDDGATYPITLDLAFTGQGPLTGSDKGTTVLHQIGPFTVIVERSASKSRDAGVTGTITINGATPDASFSSSTLASYSSATVTVQKPQ